MSIRCHYHGTNNTTGRSITCHGVRNCLFDQRPALFEARVVDLLCELTGDCPEDCGAGKRHIGLIRSADNVLILPNKNSQAAFSGAAVDLAPYCNQVVEVDGLMLVDEEENLNNIYQVQKVRVDGGEWQKANKFTKIWKQEFPEAAGKGAWFRRDPRIKALLAETGYLGLGLEADEAFKKEWFE